MLIGGIVGMIIGVLLIIAGIAKTPVIVSGNGQSGVMSGTGVIVIGAIVGLMGLVSLIKALA